MAQMQVIPGDDSIGGTIQGEWGNYTQAEDGTFTIDARDAAALMTRGFFHAPSAALKREEDFAKMMKEPPKEPPPPWSSIGTTLEPQSTVSISDPHTTVSRADPTSATLKSDAHTTIATSDPHTAVLTTKADQHNATIKK